MMQAMARKPTARPDDPEEYKRFFKTAREVGADESPEAFERAFKKIVVPKPPLARKSRQ
jgi:hypothetical protein